MLEGSIKTFFQTLNACTCAKNEFNTYKKKSKRLKCIWKIDKERQAHSNKIWVDLYENDANEQIQCQMKTHDEYKHITGHDLRFMEDLGPPEVVEQAPKQPNPKKCRSYSIKPWILGGYLNHRGKVVLAWKMHNYIQ